MPDRPDSGISMQDALVLVLQQEVSEWKAKFQTEKEEVLRLSGASFKHNRKGQILEREAEGLKATVAEYNAKWVYKPMTGSIHAKVDSSALANLHVKYDQLQTKYYLRNSEAEDLEANISKTQTDEETRNEEFEVLRTQLLDAQQENKALQESSSLAQQQLFDAQRENRELQTQADSLYRAVEIYRADAIEAEDKAVELEEELLVWKPIPGGSNEVCQIVVEKDTSTSDSSSNSVSALGLPSPRLPIAPQATAPLMVDSQCQTDAPPTDSAKPDLSFIGLNRDIALTINISHTSSKLWTLLSRVQSTLTKSSALDILGPHKLVEEFVSAMNCVEADHLSASSAAAHWEKTAMQRGSEVIAMCNELNNRPLCSVFAHRRLQDELEAREMQLQIQGSVVAQWQKKMERCKVFVEEGNVEMRERGMPGI
jgi:hypothetical protein